MQGLEFERNEEVDDHDDIELNQLLEVTPRSSPDTKPPARSRSSSYDSVVERKRRMYYSNVQNMGFCEACCGLCWLFCSNHPRLGWCVTLVALYGFLVLVTDILIRQNHKRLDGYAIEHLEFIESSSVVDPLTYAMGEIDHWCLDGGDESCTCEDPLIPSSKFQNKNWKSAFHQNVHMVESFCNNINSNDNTNDQTQDVAFIGESVVEMMNGRFVGKSFVLKNNKNNNTHIPEERIKKQVSKELMTFATKIQTSFETIINDFNGTIESEVYPKKSIALGIGGDTCPNILYRLQHGELTDCLQPKVFWIILGMNDLSRTRCSEEVIFLGIVSVIQKLRSLRPDTPIVINSLLPMTDLRKNYDSTDNVPLINSFEDATSNENRRTTAKMDETDLEQYRLEEQRYKNQVKHDEKYPQLSEQEEQDVNMFLHPITKYHQSHHQLWSHIRIINLELFRFAKKHDNIFFFDASPIFLTSKNDDEDFDKHVLNTELISIRGHPTALGYEKWFQAIKKALPQYYIKSKPKQQDKTNTRKSNNEEPNIKNTNESTIQNENVPKIKKHATKNRGKSNDIP